MSRKGKKINTQSKKHDEEEIDQLSQASNSMDDDKQPDDADHSGEANMSLILKELRDFRKDSCQQLNGIKEDINKINKRMEEAEERIDAAETRIQSWEEVVSGLVKLQVQTEAKLTDLEGRTRRENIRIYGVEEGAEAMSTSVIAFVEELLVKGLELTPSTLQIERAHRALGPKPPAEASPRSLVVKFSSFKMKEDVIKKAWQKKGFYFKEKKVNVDHDYAPELQRRRRQYAEAKSALKERNIRFQSPFPVRLKVFYEDNPVVYNSAEEATADMVKRGIPVPVLQNPSSLMDQINRLTWEPSRKRGDQLHPSSKLHFKERLQSFRHRDT
ncbi:hypothetical protein KUCAC02_031084 [Chaenocephalus aceratus]|uniref:Uncharacterized protein n=1 Tax=Chaenocephalus aceratus TaxID=36190 RepID=A0ACB9XMI1_CHAAC|nr:hypothetical protein KUCAC02_031084 [Chaenocephalus aceratus]